MSVEALLLSLRDSGVELWQESGQLRYRVANGGMPPHLLAEIRARKEEILIFLQSLQLAHQTSGAIEPGKRPTSIPLSFAQQGLWIAQQLVPRGAFYNVPCALRLVGALNVAALQRSLEHIVDRHEPLRTLFRTSDGTPYQVVLPHLAIDLPIRDVSSLMDEGRFTELLIQEAREPFDLGRGPLLRTSLYRLGTHDHVLHLTMHHIVADAWSMAIFARELTTLYDAYSSGRAAELESLSVQYADFACWQRERLKGAAHERSERHWREQLTGAPQTLALPVDRPRSSVHRDVGATLPITVSAELTDALKRAFASKGATLFPVLLAAYQALLYRYTCQRDLCVGVPVANRNHRQIESLIGFFVNTLIMRACFSPGMSFRSLLTQVQRRTLGAYEHQELPIEHVLRALNVDGKSGLLAYREACFAWQNFAMAASSGPGLSLQGLAVEQLPIDYRICKADITLTLSPAERGLKGAWEYRSAMFDRSTVEALSRDYVRLLEQVVCDPDAPIDALVLGADDASTQRKDRRYSLQFFQDLDYWKSQVLADAATLSVGRRAPTIARGTVSAESMLLPETVSLLHEAAAAAKQTVARFLTAAVVLYLQRVTETPQLTVGLFRDGSLWTDIDTSANRDDQAGAVPFAVSTPPDCSLREYVAEIGRRLDELSPHRHLQDADIDRATGAARTAAAPLFNVVIDSQIGLSRTRHERPVEDLLVIFLPGAASGEVFLRLTGNLERYTPWEIEAHAENLRGFVAEIARLPRCLARELPWKAAEDLERVCRYASSDSSPADASMFIDGLIKREAQRRSSAIAISSSQRAVSYQELDSASDRLAAAVLRRGWGRGDIIAVCGKRSPELLIALLGIAKSGAACLPLDPQYPAQRLSFMLKDSGARALLLQTSLPADVDVAAVPSLRIADVLDEAIDTERVAAASNDRSALDLAFCIYTSGSTGEPKAVGIRHRGLINHNLFACSEFALTSADRVLQFASLSFDAALEEILPTWIAGATLVLRSEALPSVSEMRSLLKQERITVLNLPTAYWHTFVATLDAGWHEGTALRLVIVGGEEVATGSWQRWREVTRGTSIELLNTYGPTEATIICTTFRTSSATMELDRVPIGRPITNARIHILDPEGRPVPVGVPGEIFIAGAGVACGYLHRPVETAERFVRDAFSEDSAATMYRSGDRGRWRPDGLIEFLGRSDRQLKLRGFRIEPGEIEARLGTHPGVRQAVVVVREGAADERQLVAYVTHQDPAPSQEELRAHLRATLPDYLLPSAFVLMRSLPLTPNGKTDYKALPAPREVAGAAAPATPRNALEASLCRIWQQTLSLEQVSVETSFFELGGNSLQVIKVVHRIQQELGMQLPVTAMFQYPTIAALTRYLTRGAEPKADRDEELQRGRERRLRRRDSNR